MQLFRRQHPKALWGQPLTPELIAILLVYFVQGIIGLSQLALSFFLKDELALSPATAAALAGMAALPWVVKPLFGFLSDGLPLFGYRRRSYLIFAGLLGTGAWLTLAVWVQTAWAALVVMVLGSLAIAISDVIIDALIVERAQQESISDVGSLQSLAWGATAVGGVITAYLGGFLLEQFSTRTVFAITASFPLIVALVAGLIDESPVTQPPSWSRLWTQVSQLRQAATQRAIWLPMAFMFLWLSTPNASTAFFFFTTNELGFEPEFLGRIQLIVSLAGLLGVWVFQRFLRTVPFRTIFLWSTLLSSGLGMTMLILVTHVNRSLGISDQWFAIGDNLVLTVIGKIAFMPLMVLAARLCPEGVEATLFALLMSIFNLAGLVSTELGALLTHGLGITETSFDHLWILVLITNGSTLLPLFCLGWLPDIDMTSEVNTQIVDQGSLTTDLGGDLQAQKQDLEVDHAI